MKNLIRNAPTPGQGPRGIQLGWPAFNLNRVFKRRDCWDRSSRTLASHQAQVRAKFGDNPPRTPTIAGAAYG
jgi:hypothetical protein